MAWLSRSTMTAALAFAVLLAAGTTCVAAEDEEHGPCTEDAMLVFDASGSMAGNEGLGIATQASPM